MCEDNKDYYFITLSGKAGVGKDYIAGKLQDKLNNDIQDKVVYNIAYADNLRTWLDLLQRGIYMLPVPQVSTELEVRRQPNLKDLDEDNLTNLKTGDFDVLARVLSLPVDVITKYEKTINKQLIDFSNHNDPRYRRVLQWFGTDVMRKQNQNYWVDSLVEDVMLSAKKYNDSIKIITIISDARFKNEITRLSELVPNAPVLSYHLLDSDKHIHEKMINRDSNEMTEKEKHHSSETSLDTFDGFTNTFDCSENSTDDIVNGIYKQLVSTFKEEN